VAEIRDQYGVAKSPASPYSSRYEGLGVIHA
jgi:hypothetical protein